MDGLPQLLRTFTAKFAKWRYETLYMCFSQLLPLRPLCETLLATYATVWFSSFQDGVLLRSVAAACADKELWVFVAVFFERAFRPLERARRWGMVCPCCSAQRAEMDTKQVCPDSNNSRRLKEARLFTTALAQDFSDRGKTPDFEAAERIHWIALSVS